LPCRITYVNGASGDEAEEGDDERSALESPQRSDTDQPTPLAP
jgi:hypothetical protein